MMADDVKDNPQNEGSNAPPVPESEDIAEKKAYLTSHGDIGLVTDAEHALALVRGKATQFHQIVNNIGNVASVPFKEVEALGAELQYLIGVIRSKV